MAQRGTPEPAEWRLGQLIAGPGDVGKVAGVTAEGFGLVDGAQSASYPFAPVDDFGADPTGADDSAQAFRDALATGLVVLGTPGATYRIGSTVDLDDNDAHLIGIGATIDATAIASAGPVFEVTGVRVTIEGLTGLGKMAANAADSATGGHQFIRAVNAYDLRLENINTSGFSNAIVLHGVNRCTLENCRTEFARNHGLVIMGATLTVSAIGCLWQTSVYDGSGAGTEPGNVYILADGADVPHSITLRSPTWDETGGGEGLEPFCVYVKDGKAVRLEGDLLYLPDGGVGVKLGAGAERVIVNIAAMEPFDPGNVPSNTITIDSGALDCTLLDITTDPHGGGDIADASSSTTWLNVNGQFRVGGTTFDTTPLPPFDPTEVAGLAAWWDFSAVAAGAIASHADGSGNGHTATQGTGANQPTGVASVQNGLNIARFDGSNDHLRADSMQLGTKWTVFAVLRHDSQPGAYTSLLSCRSSTDEDPLQDCDFWPDNVMTIAHRGDTTPIVVMQEGGSDPGLGGFHAYTWERDGGAIRIERDNTLITLSSQTFGATTTNRTTLAGSVSLSGLSNPLDADIAEVVVFNRRLSQADKDRLWTYLSDKWAL